jgi:urease accessory protein UreE
MVETSDDISKLVVVVAAQCKILASIVHVVHKSQLAFIIDYVAFLTGNRHVPFLTTHKQELVVWDIQSLEIPREVMLGKLVIIDKFEFFEVSNPLHIVVYLQSMRVKRD